MATSKGRGGAAAKKSAASKKSTAPSKSSNRSADAASSSSRGPAKASAPARGAASKAASKATAPKKAAASKSAASKGAASKSTASARNGSPSKSTAGRGTAVKASAGRSAASRNTPARASSSRPSKSVNTAGDPRNDLEKILQDLMKDIYYAEKKLVKALGKMARNATNPKLKEAFTTHQAQTEEQVTKLEKAFGVMGIPPKAKKCAAMDGLLEEANEHIEEYSKGAGLDAAMIVGAQKVEHYEIAAYGSMRSIAKTLGYQKAAMIFEEIREQESDTDELLTTLAESVINPQAEEETEDVSKIAKTASRGNSNGNGREGGDDTMALSGDEGGSISGMTDGNNREGASETGPAMGY